MSNLLMKAFALCTVSICLFGLVGCGSDSNTSATGGGVPGGNAILTGGGLGGENGGSGGAGNYIELYNSNGTGGNIVVSAAGQADANFSPSSFPPYYGTNPLTINANMTIAQETLTEPSTGTVYLGSDNSIYISDGDGILGPVDADELPVTGVLINAGSTVTFGVLTVANLNIDVVNDFVNYGTITSANQSIADRGDLSFNVGSFQNFGTIALNATDEAQNGGTLTIYGRIPGIAGGSILNHGVINTYGGDATDANAGGGGSVTLYGDHFVENTASINSYGGSSSGTSGIGGTGGNVYLETDLGDTRNSATLNTYGGDGITGGGGGGYVSMYIDYTGDCVNSGVLNTYGGSTATGIGGSGGDVEYDTWQGGIRHDAAINARGGSATDVTGSGGNGGYTYFGSWSGSSNEPTPGYYSPIKDTEISGNIDLRGGNAVATGSGNGGNGGYFYVYVDGSYLPLAQEMRLLGYQTLNTQGGHGNYGGNAGYVYGWQEYANDYDQYFSSGGYRFDGVDIDTRGGNVVANATTTPAAGGDGGSVEFDMNLYTYSTASTVPFAPPKFYLNGSINTSGGNNLNQTVSTGNAGFVYIYAKAGVTVNGDITARGGDDLGTVSGYGGAGNSVSLMADYADVTIDGHIDMSGGNGALFGGSAGWTSDPVAATSQGNVKVGNIIADGGDADPALSGSVGGNAQDFWLFAPQGPSAVSFGTLSAKGGVGETVGINGVITAGSYQVAP